MEHTNKLSNIYYEKSKQRLNQILAKNTGKAVEEIGADTERDNYMLAEQALAYGLIDKIIAKRE